MDLIPGFCQHLVCMLISYPFDVVKTNMQTNGLSMKESIITIWKRGPQSFYRGVTLGLSIGAIGKSFQYYTYEHLNKKVNPFLSGWIVGFLSGFYSTPLQSITSNALLDHTYNGNIINYSKNYIQEHSIKRLFKGLKVDLLRMSIFTSLHLGLYGNLRSKTNNHIINGIIANIMSWVFVFPFDTIRTRLQTSNLNYRQISYQHLWRGFTPLVIRTVPSAGIGMYIYEKTRQYVI